VRACPAAVLDGPLGEPLLAMSGSVVGKSKPDCIAHAMISQRPIEVVARHDFCPE
jgi:hypothetical protein